MVVKKTYWNAKHKLSIWAIKNDDGRLGRGLGRGDTGGINAQWMECPRCDGSGDIPHPTKWEEGKKITCPRCKGAGNIKE